MRRALLALFVLCFALPAHAWSYKEHIQLTRIAAERIIADPDAPPAMKDWLRQITPGLRDLAAEKEFFLHTHVGRDVSNFKGLERWAAMPDVLAQQKDPDFKHARTRAAFHRRRAVPQGRPEAGIPAGSLRPACARRLPQRHQRSSLRAGRHAAVSRRVLLRQPRPRLARRKARRRLIYRFRHRRAVGRIPRRTISRTTPSRSTPRSIT